MNECREAFEKWCKAQIDPLSGEGRYSLKREACSYYYTFTFCAWEAWQAAWNYKEKSDEAKS
jgi:hypothetical protein